jgi:hypothetical protein
MEQQLEISLGNLLPGWRVRCRLNHNHWIIEVIPTRPAQLNKDQVFEKVKDGLSQLPNGPQIIWRVFIYLNADDRFQVNGTLHTEKSFYSDGGIHTVTLSAGDAYLSLSEYDGEILQMCYRAGDIIEGIETLGSNGLPILGFQMGQKHVWLESLGGEYHLADDDPVTVDNPGNVPLRLKIKLGD